jgi:glycine/serine hydroxymethyltransferase
MSYEILKAEDPELYGPFMQELERQRTHIELIASENFTAAPSWRPWAAT